MKLLQELLYTGNTLVEGQVDPHVLMSIDNIIKNGKISETFQTIALARMLEYFKNGIFYKEQNFFDPFVSTSKALLDTLRALDPEDAVELAKKMRELLEIKDKDLLNHYVNPEQEAIAYIKFVTSREAND